MRPRCDRGASRVLAALALGLLASCASGDTAPGAPASSAASTPATPITPADPSDPTIARRPYSPEEIRGNMPVGSWTRYRLEQAGRPPVLRTTEVTAADAEGVTMSSTLTSESGESLGPPQEERAGWVELQHHATFPLGSTVVTEQRLDTPSGAWDCWLYTVSTMTDGTPEVARFHFAKDKPGAPVRYEQVVDGNRVFLMTLVGLGNGS